MILTASLRKDRAEDARERLPEEESTARQLAAVRSELGERDMALAALSRQYEEVFYPLSMHWLLFKVHVGLKK